MTLIGALGLEDRRLIAVVGAGGKTTLMMALAGAFADAGERVLFTTTTRIAATEADGPWPLICVGDDALRPARKEYGRSRVVIAVAHQDGSKLVGLAPGMIDRLAEEGSFDRVLVEADGAARRPLKAAADHEPVIPFRADAAVMVAGLSAIGERLGEEVVFRSSLWAARSNTPMGDPIGPDSVAAMALHPEGLGKGIPGAASRVLLLNQVETPATLQAARRIADLLSGAGPERPDRLVAGRLLPRFEIVEAQHLSLRENAE